MAIYEFEAPDGRRVELYFPIGTAPGIGKAHTPEEGDYEGVKLVRKPTVPRANVAPNFNFASHSLPRYAADHDTFDDKGRPVFTSKKQATEYAAKSEGTVVWD